MPKTGENASSEESCELTASGEELPDIRPPQTKTPIHFNQQINNFQQVPPTAWDGLTPEQRLQLAQSILKQWDVVDQRHYAFAMRQIESERKRSMLSILGGTLIAVAGFTVAGYLALHNQTQVALAMTTSLVTILATVIGNRFLSKP